MSNIQIKILSSEDFDNLGPEYTRGADVSDSLGFADAHNNRVFVRNTGVNELNKYLVDHEVSHLFEAEGTDEDGRVPGIRHKKFKEAIRTFYNPINLPIPGLQNKERGIANIGASEQRKERDVQAQPSLQPQAAPQYGGQFGGPLGAFSTAGPAAPNVPGGAGSNVSGGLTTGLGGGGLNQGIDPSLRERVKGFFSGRVPF